MRAVESSAFNATRVCSTTRAHMQLELDTMQGASSNENIFSILNP